MKFVTNLRINFVNESALTALPLGVDNMSDIAEKDPEKECAGDESELAHWISEFKRELEPKQKNKIYEILRANGFTTRLKLKLAHEDELNIMFNTGSEALSLGAKTLLACKLNVFEGRITVSRQVESSWQPRQRSRYEKSWNIQNK